MRARLMALCLLAAAFLPTATIEAAVAYQATGITAPRRVKPDLAGWTAATVDVRYVRDGSARRQRETLFRRYPLKLAVQRDGSVAVTWRSGSAGEFALVSSAPAADRYTVRFACDSRTNVWQLDVNGRTDLAPAYGNCLGQAWGKVFVGGATLSNEPIRGRLDLSVSDAGAGTAVAADPDPDPPPAPSPSPSPEPTGAAELVADHEPGDFSQWPNSGMVLGGKKSYSQHVVEWDGDQVGRFEVREGEAGPDRKVRSEVSDTTVKKNSEWWYSWRTQIPHDWKDNDSTWYIVTQFHQAPPLWRNGDWGPPPLKFGYSGGRWEISQWFYDLDHPRSPLYDAPGTKGEWVHWRVHAVWSGDSDGLLQIWRNGELVVDRHGKNLNGDGGGGTFFKQGIYRGYGDPNTQVILHDDYRRGPTRSCVK